jgi:site-specific recombinase XerD
MTLDDLGLDQRIVWVLGKGRRPRALPIGRKTAQALDRYLGVRDEHRLSHLPHLWVGRNGPMTPSGIYQVVHDRARAAGLPAMHPHQLRHAFATSWLAEGGSDPMACGPNVDQAPPRSRGQRRPALADLAQAR